MLDGLVVATLTNRANWVFRIAILRWLDVWGKWRQRNGWKGWQKNRFTSETECAICSLETKQPDAVLTTTIGYSVNIGKVI